MDKSRAKNDVLISIVIPVFNAENFLLDTIKTLTNQTYQKWEAIFVDDCSKDNSVKIIESVKDKRIKLIRQNKNSGTASARNAGIMAAKGNFLCFIDADDAWDKKKLEKQLLFMQEKQCAFSFTGYEFANRSLKPTGKKVFVPQKIDYKKALKNTIIFVGTVMINLEKITKEDILMPNVKSEDTATWWKILKKVDYAYGLNEILSLYRRSNNTKSANKINAIKQTWELYRKIEKLNIFKSLYYFCCYAFNATRRRI